MNFARDILPLLIAGGGMAAVAKSGLLGGNNPLSEKELASNNQIWDRLGRGASASPNAMGPAAPKAANPLAGSAPIPNAMPSMANPAHAFHMPDQLQGGQQPSLLAAGAGPQPMMAQEWAYPNSMHALMRGQQPPSMAFSTDQQQPQQWANPATINYGLLGNSRGVA